VESGESTTSRSFQPGDLVGDLFADRFRVLRLVSTGANTAIFDATDDENGRTVTLKLIRPRLAASPSFRNRFDETMRAVSALSHPNIAAVYDWGLARVADTSTAYVVNEYLAGGSLRDLFDRGRRLSPSQALGIGLDACRALDHAHRRRFVHAELNPSKIVFGDDRRLRIIDFGLARLLSSPAWERPDSVPTHVAWYAAPEQGLGQRIDGRADVYALALTLHEAVTGTLPFKSDSTVASLSARVGKLMPVSADLGPLASILERAGRPDAAERSTAAELGRGLLSAAAKLPRPEPLPLLSTGLFDTPLEQLRSPDDPTGGLIRPAPAPLVLVPLDEPSEHDDHRPVVEAVSEVPPDEPTPDEPTPDEPTPDEPTLDGSPVVDSPVADAPALAPDPLATVPLVDEPAEADVAEAEVLIVPIDVADDGGGDDEPVESVAPLDLEAADEPVPGDDPTDDLVIAPIDADHDGVTTTRRELEDDLVIRDVATAPIPVVEAEPPSRRRGVPWKLLLGLLVVAALAALGVVAMQLFQRATYPVPDLRGEPVAEARNQIAENGWIVDVQEERSDEVPTVGQVVRTAPAAGVELAEEEPFLIVVSAGPLLRELPESTGLLASKATTDLVALRLDVTTVEQYDEEVPAGTVISWSVPGEPSLAAGAEVEPETPVELVVSLGPAPREVPELDGLPLAEARAAVEEIQLALVEAEQVFSDDVPLGSVVSQEPAAGAEVERGAEVTVAISRGPDLVSFPDVSEAASYAEAADLLRTAGFEPVLLLGDAEAAVQSIRIGDEEPEVGERFRRGAVVEIIAF
jgi:beta-lactam-binding protein with PASTA domain/serine/threonine protein kinase